MAIVKTFPVGPLQCNCTVIASESSGDAFVVDPGDQGDVIVQLLASQGFQCRAILHTHAHIDHVGGTKAVRDATGAPILLHAKDQPVYDSLPLQAAWVGLPVPDTLPVDRYVEHGELLEAGDLALDVLHTPGHTPGSLSFRLHGEHQLVLSGDTLFAGSIGRTDLPGGNFDEIINSIHERLMPLADPLPVIPGHGPTTTIGRERKSNPFING